VVNDVARHCGNIDLHVISGVGADLSARHPSSSQESSQWTDVGWGAVVVAASTLLCWPLSHHLDRVNLIMIYLLGVVWTAYRFNQKAAFLASVLSVLSFDFFFVPPALTFAVTDSQYVLTFGIMLGVGLLISTITSRLRLQTAASRKREDRMRVLYKLSRELSETPDVREMLQTAQKELEGFYKLPVLILTPDTHGDLAVSAGDSQSFDFSEKERSVVQWVFDKGRMAGAGSDTLAGSAGLYLPLKGMRGTVGVIGVRPIEAKSLVAPEQLQLLETFAGEIGGALDSTRMSEAMGRAEIQAELRALERPQTCLPAGRAETPLRVGDFLTEDHAVILKEGQSKDEILRILVSRLSLPNPAQALHAILEREKTGETLIGAGVMIPHTRLPGLKTLHAALGVSEGGPVHLWLLFVSPMDDARIHLTFLSALSALFQNEAHVDALAKMKSPKEILDYIRESEIRR
jgi:mannitol/fructose-specific phosphotransferase system IIA component (Ntr-type)